MGSSSKLFSCGDLHRVRLELLRVCNLRCRLFFEIQCCLPGNVDALIVAAIVDYCSVDDLNKFLVVAGWIVILPARLRCCYCFVLASYAVS